jgi:hypothetical protein
MIKLLEITQQVHFVCVHSNGAGWGIFGGHGTKGQMGHCGWPTWMKVKTLGGLLRFNQYQVQVRNEKMRLHRGTTTR